MKPRIIQGGAAAAKAPGAEAPSSLWQAARRRLAQNRLAIAGLIFFALVSLACFAGPVLYRHSPETHALALGSKLPFASLSLVEVRYDADKPTPDELTTKEDFQAVYAIDPEADLAVLEDKGKHEIRGIHFQIVPRFHLLGTDSKGRDMLARLMHGGRISLGVAFLATGTALLIGVSVGLASGYFGGRIDALLMRLVDILYALPFFIFVILLMMLFDGFEHRLLLVFLAIGAVEWLTMARIVRGQVLHLKEQEFIAAARATGVRPAGILLKHLVPNVLGHVAVYATLLVPAVMLMESTLSFLGLGMSAQLASWGTLIKEGQEAMRAAPWELLAPCAVFSATLFAMNFLGDGLRDALDARSSSD